MTPEQRTLGFLKPDVMKKKDELLTIIKANTQWKITFEQELILSIGEAKTLYPKDVEAMWLSSHPIYVFILEGNNVIHNWLEFVGPMNPLKAKQSSPQSLRALYGTNQLHNVCHASGSIQLAYQDLTWLQGLVLEDLHVKKPITNDTTTTSASSSSENSNNIKKKELKKPTKLKRPSNVPSKINKPASSDNSSNNVTTSKTSSTSSASSTSSNPSVLKKKSNIVPPKPTTAIRSPIKNTSPSSSALKNTNQKSNIIPPSTTPSKLSQPKYDRLKPRTSRIASSAKDSSSKTKKSTDNKLNSNAAISMGPSNSKRISNTGGISKNTPAKSVLTGRPRKYSRARREDQPIITPLSSESPTTIHEATGVSDTIINNEDDNNKNDHIQSDPIIETSSINEEKIKELPVEENENEKEKEKEEIEGSIENITNNLTVPEPTVANDKDEEKEKEESKPTSTSTSTTVEPIEPLPSITSTTDCSQATSESDHDAEVAAATSQFMDNNNNNSSSNNNNTSITTTTTTTNTPSHITTTGFNSTNIKSNTVESPTGIIDRRLSNSSYSITSSAASTLPRPETPEVDNLRQRFESMSQLSAATNATAPPIVTTKRNSSINPEVASRIKDLKPRDPVGSRVKSMVEFFMDENLHKWEF